MTRWKVGDFDFDADSRRLIGHDGDVILEPKAAALLAYFCQHPGRSIGRDELLETVWHGQIVSDNTISRVVVLLRKALRDDARVRRYIATVPKLGYRLIADVSAVDRAAAGRGQGNATTSRWVAVLAASLAVLAGWFFVSRPATVTETRASIVPLSRLAASQSNADLASDGRALVFTARDNGWNRIFLVEAPGAEPRVISADGGHANFARWSHNDDFIVYQFTSGERCEFHQLARAKFATRDATVLHQCAPRSYTELSLSPDDSTLYFVERASEFEPYAVFALDLEQPGKRRLSQPVARGYGNHYVDVHPRSGTLLLLGDHAPGKTSVYELDPVRDSFMLRRRMTYGLDSAIWSHRRDAMVHPSRHPSYQLLETPLGEGASRVLVSDSRRISSPRPIRAANGTGRDYLFTSYLYNRDIELSHPSPVSANSAVMDYLPTLSRDGQRLAFVSKRSGDSQVWIQRLDDGQLTVIAPPDAGRRFLSLAWSDDDTRLLVNTNTGLLVHDLVEGTVLHDVALALPAYGVRWFDANTVTYSHHDDGHWHARRHHLDTGKIEELPDRWAFSVRDGPGEWQFDQSLQPFLDGEPFAAMAGCAPPVWRYQLRIQFDGDAIYCHARDAASDLLRIDARSEVTRLAGAVDRYEFFSVRAGQLAVTAVASSHSDIMRTRHGGD